MDARKVSFTAAAVAVVGALVATGTMVAARGHAGPARSSGASPASGVPTPPLAAPDQRVDPAVTPRHGRARTRFVVHLTPRLSPGPSGGANASYEIVLSGFRDPRCLPVQGPIVNGTGGRRLAVPLTPPSRVGWCRGLYGGTVLFNRAVYCPPSPPGQPPRACPAIAYAPLDAGRFRFRVR